jgi:Cft2 family RNA processing exonuclease
MAGDVDDRKSISGVAYFFEKSPVSWLSQKQKVVAQSSCEAKYIAAATAMCQGMWLRRLLGDLMNKEEERVVLNIDNNSVISLRKNPVHHDRSKHIDTKYHYIWEYVEESKIEVNYVCTNDQLADILTKSLGRLNFLEMRGTIDV